MNLSYTKFLIVFIISWFSVLSLKGQEISFFNISVNDGLSQCTVKDIVQDKNGIMWIATHDGLNRFDGYKFEVYRCSVKDSTSIADNYVNTLTLDRQGNLWIGLSGYASCYDMTKEVFKNYSLDGRLVTSFCDLGDGRILVGTESSLLILDKKTGVWGNDTLPEQFRNLDVTCLYSYEDDIYIGTKSNGIFILSDDQVKFKSLRAFHSKKGINDILSLSKDTICVATEGDGLFYINQEGEIIKTYNAAINSLASNYVRSLEIDSEGRLWVGTVNGLNIIGEDGLSVYTHKPFISGSLSHNSVRSIFRDNQGGMWLGTFFGGINYWHPLKNRFRNIVRQQHANSISDNIISAIVEDGEDLWIGTNAGGMNHYNGKTNQFSQYQFKSSDIKAILVESSKSDIYVGAHAGGLNRLDRRTKRFSQCGANTKKEDKINDVYALKSLNRDSILVGSLQGLRIYNKSRDSFTPIKIESSSSVAALKDEIEDIRIWTIFVDSNENLWIGGEKGVVLSKIKDGKLFIDEKNNKFSELTQVQSIFESKSKIIWIGTRKGLWSYNPQTNVLKSYVGANGLKSDIIHGIEEDTWGQLWISTDNGLSCLNQYSNQFRTYTSKDGIQGNQFNNYAHCRRANGEMWFGGMNGITVFIPEKMSDNPYTPSPIFTKLYIQDRLIRPDDQTGILSKSLTQTKSIYLKNKYNNFTIEFTVANNLALGHSNFVYKLEGYDSQWRNATGRAVSYTNIPHGEYRLMVKAENNDGIWHENASVLVIKILPVWYKTIWARLLFVFIIISLILLGIYLIIKRLRLSNKIKMERQESEHQEELMQMKMRFFINISHELRAPLTLILTPIKEMIARTDDKWMKNQLKYLDRNANRMLHLVNQLMDYRRADLGVFKLRVKKENVHKTIHENFSYYERLAIKRHIKYVFESHIENEYILSDGQYIELILNNLISNAFKYTEKGEIRVKTWTQQEKLYISVSDTGVGIDEKNREKVFERFYQADSNHIGSGIGLALVQRLVELHHGKIELTSKIGEGSIFTICLPTNPTAYTFEEMNDRTEDETHTTNSHEMFITSNSKIVEEQAEDEASVEKNWRILIVEDDKEISSYLSSRMSEMYNISIAQNGEEALKMLNESEYDLILTDMKMPVMDGLELTTLVRRNPETAHIPIIMISSMTGDTEQLAALHNGVDDFISKPFSFPILSAKIRNIIKSKTKIKEKIAKSDKIDTETMTYNPVDEETLKKAMEIVKRNMDNVNFSTEDFAREMHMSRSTLHLKLKAITGESALDFIKKIRFNEACRLLKEGRYTINEISDKVGFTTSSYFSSSFKKQMGCLPTEYAKQKACET